MLILIEYGKEKELLIDSSWRFNVLHFYFLSNNFINFKKALFPFNVFIFFNVYIFSIFHTVSTEDVILLRNMAKVWMIKDEFVSIFLLRYCFPRNGHIK